MVERYQSLLAEPISTAIRKSVDALVDQWERQRDVSRTLVHIDMDAFYAAVEMRDDPMLMGKPMAVGGMSMLSTANYGKVPILGVRDDSLIRMRRRSPEVWGPIGYAGFHCQGAVS